jgi:hypothetical protein
VGQPPTVLFFACEKVIFANRGGKPCGSEFIRESSISGDKDVPAVLASSRMNSLPQDVFPQIPPNQLNQIPPLSAGAVAAMFSALSEKAASISWACMPLFMALAQY